MRSFAMYCLAIAGLTVGLACGANTSGEDATEAPTTSSVSIETLQVPVDDACPGGKTAPIQVEELIKVFSTHNIVMFDDPECLTAGAERQASNAPRYGPSPRRGALYDEVVQAQGWIVCDLFADPIQPLQPVEQIRYEGDKESLFRFGNVQCIIYPHEASEAEQLLRLHDAAKDLARMAARPK